MSGSLSAVLLALIPCMSLLFFVSSPTSSASLRKATAGTAWQSSPAVMAALPLAFFALLLLSRLRRTSKPPPSPPLPSKPASLRITSSETWPLGIREIVPEEGVVDRETEMQQVVEILAKRSRSNALLVGPSGSGKTALLHSLAGRLRTAPEGLRGKKLVELDLNAVVAGTKYRGDFEEKLLGLLGSLSARREEVILVVEDVDKAIGGGSVEGGADAAGILRPFLLRGELQVIGTTTNWNLVEKDKNFLRLFQRVNVNKCDEKLTREILYKRVQVLKKFHQVQIDDEVVETAMVLGERYMGNVPDPDRTIDILDTAAVKAKFRLMYPSTFTSQATTLTTTQATTLTTKAGTQATTQSNVTTTNGRVTEEDIKEVIAKRTKIPIAKIGRATSDVKELEKKMKEQVIGQDAAIEVLMKALGRAQTGLKGRDVPIASFLFAGQSGVGKTEVARQLAKNFYDKEMIRLDMSEFMEMHAVSRLTGTSAGYVGYGEGGKLTEAVKQNPHSLILLDEVEKAHPKVFDLFLQVLGDGRLTDGKGEVVDFRNVIVIMTTNIGSQHGADKQRVEEELAKFFRPEFRNRLDDVVVFNTLQQNDLGRIYDLIVRETADRLLQTFKIKQMTTSEELKAYVIKHGFDPKFGARPLRRAVQKFVDDTLAEFALVSPILREDEIHLDLQGDKIVVKDKHKRVLYFRNLDK